MLDIRPRLIESLPVRDFFRSCGEALKLELVAGEKGLDRIIGEKSLNRPALSLVHYFRFFAAKRVQVLGAGEMAFLRDSGEDACDKAMRAMARKHIPCFIITRNLAPTKAMIAVANEFNIPLFRSPLKSKTFSTEATLLLEEKFAPRASLHGTLLDIKGVGTVIRGESGVGKSECALALVEKGHSLVSDDLIHLRLLRDHELVGSSSNLNRGYMECRGIGIIDVVKIFGVRSVRVEKRIDLIITFMEWKQGMNEQRTGLDQQFLDIIGIQIPHVEIAIRPGRDMARLVEVAAMVQALRGMGYDPAKEFNDRLIEHMTREPDHA